MKLQNVAISHNECRSETKVIYLCEIYAYKRGL